MIIKSTDKVQISTKVQKKSTKDFFNVLYVKPVIMRVSGIYSTESTIVQKKLTFLYVLFFYVFMLFWVNYILKISVFYKNLKSLKLMYLMYFKVCKPLISLALKTVQKYFFNVLLMYLLYFFNVLNVLLMYFYCTSKSLNADEH